MLEVLAAKKEQARLLKSEKGNVVYFVGFLIFAVLITFVFVILSPALQNFNTNMYVVSEKIINTNKQDAQSIQEESIKQDILDTYNGQLDSMQLNVDVLGSLYKYAWLIILLLFALVLYLFTRQNVELGVAGGYQ